MISFNKAMLSVAVYALLVSPLFSLNWAFYAPSGRDGAALIYDAMDNQMVLFGGRGYVDVHMNDVWLLNTNNAYPMWTRLDLDDPPPARRFPVAIYRSATDEMVIYGGRDYIQFFDDLWVLKLSPGSEEWDHLTPSGARPDPKSEASAIYDPVNDRLILFGGFNGSVHQNDLWAFDFNSETWEQISPSGSIPPARRGAMAVYDPNGHRLILFGGLGDVDNFNDVWVFDLNSEEWTQLSPSGTIPPGRGGGAAFFDSDNNRLIIHGGWAYDGAWIYYYNDLWALDMESLTWTELSPMGPAPEPRRNMAYAYDTQNHRLIVFGGNQYPNYYFGDLYAVEDWGPTAKKEFDVPETRASAVKIYPNPGRGPFKIEFSLVKPGPVTISVIDLQGRTLDQMHIKNATAGLNVFTWDPKAGTELPAGTYFFRLKTPYRTTVVPFEALR